jgi:uncharacterized protein DUF6221
MSDGLVAFLRDCLDEDLRGADAAAGESEPPWEWRGPLSDAVYSQSGPIVTGCFGSPIPEAFAAHAARHDPARVLAEVDAKRAIVAHAEYWFTTLRETPEGWTAETCTAYRMAMEWTIYRLAEPYADRPGYQPEWRP